jgi:protein phosphatase
MIAGLLPPAEACRLLVNLANLRGGADNVTVVIGRVGHPPDDLPPEPDDEPARAAGMSWKWLAGLWTIGLTLVVAVSLWMFSMFVEGLAFAAAAAFAAVAMFALWLELRPRNRGADGEGPPQADERGPYRVASARFEERLLNELASMESGLQRTAAEEGWSVDWKRHGDVYQKAKKLLDQEKYSAAFGELAKAIDVLMAGLLQHRKQLSHAQKWRKGAQQPEA